MVGGCHLEFRRRARSLDLHLLESSFEVSLRGSYTSDRFEHCEISVLERIVAGHCRRGWVRAVPGAELTGGPNYTRRHGIVEHCGKFRRAPTGEIVHLEFVENKTQRLRASFSLNFQYCAICNQFAHGCLFIGGLISGEICARENHV